MICVPPLILNIPTKLYWKPVSNCSEIPWKWNSDGRTYHYCWLRSNFFLLFSFDPYSIVTKWSLLLNFLFVSLVTLNLFILADCKASSQNLLNHSRVRFLEPTSAGAIWGIIVVTSVRFEPTIPMLRCRHYLIDSQFYLM